MGVGTYFVLSGNVDALKQPFLQSLETYNPDDSSGPAKALVDVWDDFQSDVSSGGNWAVKGCQKDRLLCWYTWLIFDTELGKVKYHSFAFTLSTNVAGWIVGRIGTRTLISTPIATLTPTTVEQQTTTTTTGTTGITIQGRHTSTRMGVRLSHSHAATRQISRWD